MAPKGKKGAGGNAKAGEEKREDPLQAVVFADSFETRFNPFTLERPRCLLPLANTPLIEYTLEFLASAGVEEVYLYSGNHTDMVEDYLKSSKWLAPTAPFSLEIIRSTSRSIGDCMRDLDQKQLIVGDFLCVYGDVVSNLALETALAAHRTRREKDKKCIMTMILREVTATSTSPHRTHLPHPHTPRSVFVLDPTTSRCVHYEHIPPSTSSTTSSSQMLDLAGEILRDHAELDIREDLIDSGVDICTPEVLAQYTDNFDWQLPRRGFLYGVLKDYETNQLMIHTHVAGSGYGARVADLRSYDAVSRDVVARWVYPVTPEGNWVEGQTYRLWRENVYREEGVVVGRESVLGRGTVVGKGSVVGEKSVVTNSVIGRGVKIGKRVRVEGAYVWDGAVIGDDTVVETAIVANDVVIGKKCRIEGGALLSYGVKIADGTTVAGTRRISKLKRKRAQDKDERVVTQADPEVVGEDGIGYHLELDDEEEEVVDALLFGVQNLNFELDQDAVSLFSDEDEDEDDEDDSITHPSRGSLRADSFTSVGSDESGEARHRAADFYHEAMNSIFDGLQKDQHHDNIQLELKALTLAANADAKHVRRSVAVAFTKRIANLMESGSSPKEAVDKVIEPYKNLVSSSVKGVEEESEFLLYLQTDLTHRPQGEKVLLFISNALATHDLVEAEGFEAWWNDPKSSATEELQRVRKDTERLVEALVGGSDDEDDDEDDESEEDDD